MYINDKNRVAHWKQTGNGGLLCGNVIMGMGGAQGEESPVEFLSRTREVCKPCQEALAAQYNVNLAFYQPG